MLEWLKRFIKDWGENRKHRQIEKSRLKLKAEEYRKLIELQEKKRQLDSLRKDKSQK